MGKCLLKFLLPFRLFLLGWHERLEHLGDPLVGVDLALAEVHRGRVLGLIGDFFDEFLERREKEGRGEVRGCEEERETGNSRTNVS